MEDRNRDDGHVATTIASVLYLATRYALSPCGETAAAVERQIGLLSAHPAVQADPAARRLYARLVEEWRAAAGRTAALAPGRAAPALH